MLRQWPTTPERWPPLNVFVYRPGAIGDTVLTLPALEAVRRRWPGCRITYAGNTAMLPLLPVEEAISADDPRLLPLFGEPAQRWPGADLHVVFARSPRGLPGIQCEPLEAVTRGMHVADWLADAIEPAKPRPPLEAMAHEADSLAGAVEPGQKQEPPLKIEAKPGMDLATRPAAGTEPGRNRAPRLEVEVRLGTDVTTRRAESVESPEREPRLEVEAAAGVDVVVHPGAGAAGKRWPVERFAAVVERLGLHTALVRGPAEPQMAMPQADEVWDSLPLAELAARIKGSRLFVGNDSGITHLAAAVGTATAAIYVATDPAIWGVRGEHTRRLAGPVSVEQVLAASHQLLAQSGPTAEG